MINSISGKIASTNVIKTGSNNYASSNAIAFKGAAGVVDDAAGEMGKLAKKAKFIKTKAFFNKVGSKIKEFAISMFNKFPAKVQTKLKSFKSFVSSNIEKLVNKAKSFISDVKANAVARKQAKAAKKQQNMESPSLDSKIEKQPTQFKIKEKTIYDKETGKIPVQIQKIENGRIIEKTDIDAFGKPTFKTDYVKGKKIAETTYKDGIPSEKFVFDNKGKKTEYVKYNLFGEWLDHEVYMNGERWVTKFTTSGEKVVATLHYGADGKLISNESGKKLLYSQVTA